MEKATGWPVYFAGMDIAGATLTIKKGDAFPAQFQDPNILRGFAKAAGVKNPDAVPFHKLPFVKIVAAGSQAEADSLVHLSYAEAVKATERRAA